MCSCLSLIKSAVYFVCWVCEGSCEPVSEDACRCVSCCVLSVRECRELVHVYFCNYALGNDQTMPRSLLLDHTSTILYLCNSDSSKTY